jgi:hypothetical protein
MKRFARNFLCFKNKIPFFQQIIFPNLIAKEPKITTGNYGSNSLRASTTVKTNSLVTDCKEIIVLESLVGDLLWK